MSSDTEVRFPEFKDLSKTLNWTIKTDTSCDLSLRPGILHFPGIHRRYLRNCGIFLLYLSSAL